MALRWIKKIIIGIGARNTIRATEAFIGVYAEKGVAISSSREADGSPLDAAWLGRTARATKVLLEIINNSAAPQDAVIEDIILPMVVSRLPSISNAAPLDEALVDLMNRYTPRMAPAEAEEIWGEFWPKYLEGISRDIREQFVHDWTWVDAGVKLPRLYALFLWGSE